LILLLFSLATFLVYLATSGGTTPYDYFTRLGAAFLQGKYYLTSNPPWLNELIPIGVGKFAVVYPPSPAILSIPFIIAFGQGKKIVSLWVFLLVAFGNIVWFLAATGSVWYLGQVSAFLFLSLTIYESLNKRRWGLVALYFGLAILSRLQVVMALPIILYLNKNYIKILAGLTVFGIAFAFYNYLRFGNVFETGYGLIPGVLDEPWYQKGIFDLSYIGSNLKAMFLSVPIIKNTFPYITPSWGGLSIFITSPVFIYSLFASSKSRENMLTWLSVFLITLVVLIHGGTGFTQFGYRYAVDFYPLLLLLIINAIDSKKLSWHHWLLLLVSILVNLWGVVFINKFGWVGF